MEEYTIELEKLMASEVALTYWATNMDLLAVITFDNLLELYRINYKIQKVFHVEEPKPIKCLSFSPDSHLIAYGMIDGTITIMRTENGERVVVVENVHSSEVEHLNYVPFCKLNPSLFMPFQANSIESKLLINIAPHKNCNKNAIVKIKYFSEMGSEFVFLLSSERQKTLLLINGFMLAAQITYKQLALPKFRVVHTHYDTKIRAILSQDLEGMERIHLIEYDVTRLKEIEEDVIKYSTLIAYITQILAFVETTYDAAESLTREIVRQYNSKINLIDDGNIQGLNPCAELLKYLNCGTTSTSLINFFTKEVFDTKILQKLDETLNAVFGQLHQILLESTQNGLERAAVLFKKLMSLSEIRKFQIFGLQPGQLRRVEDKLYRLYTMGEILLVESTEAKFDIRNLLVWLNKATIKSPVENDNEIENMKSYLSRYTVDFNRLHLFLSDQNRFSMKNLLGFFTKGKQAYQMSIRPPDFKIITEPERKKDNASLRANKVKLEKLLDLDESISEAGESMNVEYSYLSFKLELKSLKEEWAMLTTIPVERVSKLICDRYTSVVVGDLKVDEVSQFDPKAVIQDGQLSLYFVSREEDADRLIRYNCHTKTKHSLICSRWHLLSVAVAEGIVGVFEQKITGKKFVAQITNSVFNGGDVVLGKTISKVEGELDINSSIRGLNSLVIDKNKLVIFD